MGEALSRSLKNHAEPRRGSGRSLTGRGPRRDALAESMGVLTILTVNLKVVLMERFMGIEEARGKLGELAREVEERGEPVVLTKRGRPLAVLLNRDEYGRFKLAETASARAEVERYLVKVRRNVKGTALKRSVVDEAIAAVRRAR